MQIQSMKAGLRRDEIHALMSVNTKPSQTEGGIPMEDLRGRFLKILDAKQVGGLTRSLRSGIELLCILGKPDLSNQESQGIVDMSEVIFIFDRLMFDKDKNLIGRVRPAGPYASRGVTLLKDEKFFSKVKFHPVFVENNRGWRHIASLYMTYR